MNKNRWKKIDKAYKYLKSSSSSTTFSSGSIGWNWGNIFNSSNLETASGQSSDCSLSTWAWAFGLGTSSSSEFNMDSIDTDFLELLMDFLGSHHSSIRRSLFSITGDLHTSSDSAISFLSRQISDVNESVVPSSHDMSNSDNGFLFRGNVWTVGLYLLLLFMDFLLHV